MSDARFVTSIEIVLLAIIAIGSMVMAGLSIKNKDASGAAAWSGLLMAIVNVIKDGRSSRTIDRMAATAAASSPPSTGDATGKPGDPVHTVEEKR
jgi:hypothetical protein